MLRSERREEPFSRLKLEILEPLAAPSSCWRGSKFSELTGIELREPRPFLRLAICAEAEEVKEDVLELNA